jgi:hypothetical protein
VSGILSHRETQTRPEGKAREEDLLGPGMDFIHMTEGSPSPLIEVARQNVL